MVTIEDDAIFDFYPPADKYKGMYCQVNIIEADGYVQPHRIFKNGI